MDIFKKAAKYLHEGDYVRADATYKKILKKEPYNISIIIEVGCIAMLTRKFDEAQRWFERGLKIESENRDLLINMGNALNRKRKYEEALAYYEKVLNKDPNDQAAISNVANTFYSMGKLDKALPNYRQLLSTNFNEVPFMHNYISALFSAGKLNDVSSEIVRLIKEKQLSGAQATGLYVVQAITNYVQDNIYGTQEALKKSENMPEDTPDYKGLLAYQLFLNRLLIYWKEHSESFQQSADKFLYLLGDSHIFCAAHGQMLSGDMSYKCVPLLNRGCKAWHLATPTYNLYKRSFEVLLEQIPDGSVVFFCSGEIDCRHDEGIFSNHKKHPKSNLQDDIAALVNDYVDYVVNMTSSRHLTPGFCGVPACNTDLSSLSEEDKTTFLGIIVEYNTFLKQRAEKDGFPFVDLYKIGTGQHLDEYHLCPDAFLQATETALSSVS